MSRNATAMPLLLALMTAVVAPAAQSATPEDVDTSQWRCRFCPYPEEGVEGSVRAGVGYVSQDSAKFGEYNDLDEDEAFVDAGVDLVWTGSGATRWEAQARDLGLGTRSIRLAGGEQGSYQLRFLHTELVDHEFDSAATPFRNTSDNVLRLPDGWVRAPSTAGMDQLGASLRSVDVETERSRTGLGGTFEGSEHWSYTLDYRHERRDGERVTGATFLVTPVQLLEPVEYRTDTIDAGVRYEADQWHVSLDYHGSLFRNDHRGLVWDNPFTAVAPGADVGTLSLPPDNQLHRISLSGVSAISRRFTFSGELAAGYMLQDDSFLAPTANLEIAGPELPRTSADAEVATLSANARLLYRPPVAGLSFVVDYRGNVRDNDTPRADFTQIVTDTFTGTSARNDPLSWSRHTLAGRLRYQLAAGRRLGLGVEYEDYDRDYGAEPSTEEYRVFGEFDWRLGSIGEMKVELEHAERSGSDQAPLVVNGAPQNPLMTWFDIADRTEDGARVALTLSPADAVNLTLRAEAADADFDDTVLGRTGRTSHGYGLELSAVPHERVTVYAYGMRHNYETEQRNSQSFGLPDWRGETDDSFDTLGLGGRITGIRDRLDLELDLTYADSASETLVDLAAAAPGIPDIDNERFTAQLNGTYRLRDDLTLGLNVTYEDFRRRAWPLDGVDVDTIPGMLTLGLDNPDHDLVVVLLTATYTL